MTAPHPDSFGARGTLEVGGRALEMFRLEVLQERFDVARLPFSLKILLENLLRTEDGTTVTADDIEALTQSTGSRFSVWLGPGSEWRLAWLQPTTYFVRPLYRVNYMYSKLLALRYIDLLHRDPAQFKKNYLALLSNGYDAPPDVLLQRFVGTRIDDPALIDGAVGVLDSWLKELETLYGP